MRNYDPKKYIKLVENSDFPLLRKFMKDELDFLNRQIEHKNSIIDLGSGYGRIIPYVKEICNEYWGVEINKLMYNELERRALKTSNIKTINGDITNLGEIISTNNVPKDDSLYLLLQNTIGTIEGDRYSLLKELRILLKYKSAELVISFFKSSYLKTIGLEMFKSISDMVGEPDFSKCDFENGLFVSNTDYVAKWWSDEEIFEIIDLLNAKVVSYKEDDEYIIFRLKRKQNEKYN